MKEKLAFMLIHWNSPVFSSGSITLNALPVANVPEIVLKLTLQSRLECPVTTPIAPVFS